MSENAAKLRDEGVAALRAGHPDQARELLRRSVDLNASDDSAWMWLFEVGRTDEERSKALTQALAANPANTAARAEAETLGLVLPALPALPAPTVPAAHTPAPQPQQRRAPWALAFGLVAALLMAGAWWAFGRNDEQPGTSAETTATSTQAANTEPTPGQPAEELATLLFQEGDLPAGYSGGVLSATHSLAPLDDANGAQPLHAVEQELLLDGQVVGRVVVVMYERIGQAQERYLQRQQAQRKTVEVIQGSRLPKAGESGEQASVGELSYGMAYVWMKRGGVKTYLTEIDAQRCTALLHIELTHISDLPLALSYAERLDQRVQQVACE